MKKSSLLKCMTVGVLFIGSMQESNAQLLKNLKDAVGGKNESSTSSNSKNPSKMTIIGEDLIGSAFEEDPYGINGIYYAVDEETNRMYVAKFEVKVSETKSKVKGAEEFPEYLELKYWKYSSTDARWGDLEGKKMASKWGEYFLAQHLVETKELFFTTEDSGAPPLYQLAPGVLLSSESWQSASITSCRDTIPEWKVKDIVKNGQFYVKNKEEASKWGNNPETIEIVKKKLEEHRLSIRAIQEKSWANKDAKNDMPAIGKLNTKFIQDRALKTYNEKYDPIHKGWKHHYMYVHGNEWVNKKARNKFGELVDTHRELHVVIVRTNPAGECRADLMYYVELYQDGKYNAPEGKVTGPVSYIGMPGGVLPCEKSEAFKSKLAK